MYCKEGIAGTFIPGVNESSSRVLKSVCKVPG